MSALYEFVKASLPTPWSRRVAIASLTLATALLFLPEWWPRIGLDPTDQPQLLPRLLAATTILFLGTLATLSLVVRAYINQADHQRIEDEKKPHEQLDATREKILIFLAKSGGSTKEKIAAALKINIELVVFHLNELGVIEFVHYPAPYSPSETWSIAQEGRAYLHNHGLL